MNISKAKRSNWLPAILILLAIMLLIPSAQSQTISINKIRLHYNVINNSLDSFRVVKKTLEGYSAEGATLKVYFDNGGPKKIYVKYFGETGYSISEYYFRYGKVIFGFHQTVRYDGPIQQNAKITDKDETRLYFSRGKLIKWLGKHNQNFPYNKSQFRTKAKEVKSDVKELLTAAKMSGDTLSRGDILKAMK